MKKIAIIGSAGIPANYGGFETLVENLVNQMSDDYEITVFCSARNYSRKERKRRYKNARLRYIPLKANGIQSVPYDVLSILRALFFADTLLILGVSGCFFLPIVKFFSKKRIIVHIDGLEWRREKWGNFAQKFLKFSEKIALKHADAIISDNEAIRKYTSRHHGISSAVIEYGGDHALRVHSSNPGDFPGFQHLIGTDYCFSVARIEPENNIHMILEAFKAISKRLVIVGNWKNSQYGLHLLKEYGEYPNIFMLDPIYDPRTLGVLRSNAGVYIHGHQAGGTNPSLVEAMYLGLPIMCYNVVFNRETTEYRARYFKTAEELGKMVDSISSYELDQMAMTMHGIATRRYTWEVIARKYSQLIESVQKNAIHEVRIKTKRFAKATELDLEILE